jgi:FMN phosphatase YigB (HAD superfamily)
MRVGCSPPFEDARPFLEEASSSCKLVLASNHVGGLARRTVATHNWEKYFAASVISSDCGFRKPSRRFFRELLRVSGVASPSEVLCIGDSLVNDVYGATSSGLKAVLLTRDGTAREHPGTVPWVSSLVALINDLKGIGHSALKHRRESVDV